MPRKKGRPRLTRNTMSAIARMRRDGDTIKHTAHMLGVSKASVSRYTGGVPAVAPPLGRPPALTPAQKEVVVAAVVEYGPCRQEELADIAQNAGGRKLSFITIRRALVDAGMRHYATQKGPSIREVDKPRRVKVAKMLIRDYQRCLFVDETMIGKLHEKRPGYWGDGPGMYYQEAFPVGLRSNAIGITSATHTYELGLPKGTTTGPVFAAWLDNVLSSIKKEDIIVVTDNARVHTTQDVQNVVRLHGVVHLLLPPYSPDMMPLEHMFATLKRRLEVENRVEQIHSIAELDGAAKEVWKNVTVKNVFTDYVATLESIRDGKGEYTGG